MHKVKRELAVAALVALMSSISVVAQPSSQPVVFPPTFNQNPQNQAPAVQAPWAPQAQTPPVQAPPAQASPPAFIDESDPALKMKVFQLLKEAHALIDQKNYQQAVQLLEQAVKYDPNSYSSKVHNHLGLAFEFMNDTDRAIDEYKRTLYFDPSLEVGKHNLSNMYCKKAKQLSDAGNLDNAQGFLLEAIKLNPTQPMFHNNLGSAFQSKGDLDSAIGQYNQALAIDPHMELATLNLAKCYVNVGQFDQAKVYFAKYIQDHPDSPKCQEARERLDYLEHKTGMPQDDNGAPDYFKAASIRGVMRWPMEMMPIKVFIDPGSGVNGIRPFFQQAIANAFTDWSQASNNRLTWRPVAYPQEADIVCTFAPDNTNFKNHATDPHEQGEVSSYMTYIKDGQKYIRHASLAIATFNSITGRNLSDGEARNVALHEVGHALGLVGHSPNYHDIMFFITNPGGGTTERRLSQRDVTTINMLYSDYPGTVSISR